MSNFYNTVRSKALFCYVNTLMRTLSQFGLPWKRKVFRLHLITITNISMNIIY